MPTSSYWSTCYYYKDKKNVTNILKLYKEASEEPVIIVLHTYL